MKIFWQDLLHKAVETVVVVVATASTKWMIAKCKNGCEEKTTPTPSKRKKGGSSKKN